MQFFKLLFILGILFSSNLFASKDYVPGRLIVKFKENAKSTVKNHTHEIWIKDALAMVGKETGLSDVDNLLKRTSFKKIRRLLLGRIGPDASQFGLDRLYILYFDSTEDLPKLKKELEKLPEIEYVTFDHKKKLYRVPNDPLYGPDYWTQTWHLPRIHAPEAWDITTGDSSIVVGPIDSGVDWQHPDIRPNLWVNPGEDINHNGVFDQSDLNGQDDDGDGYVDDIIGFDFVDYDWDPTPTEPGNDHGTHVFGLAAGATNNGLGIASISWNVKGMAFKCGDANYIYISDAINAIYYAANHGAVATNHSYGGSYNPSEYNAMQYAWQHGVVVCAAAGNDSSYTPHYPAAYPNVIGVVATTFDDYKAGFSNYGTWVDVCAPGVNIVSTVPGNQYAFFDGTSMATPIVTGLAGLIRSLHPEFTAQQTANAIMWGCDNIDSLNPDYAGMLGWGRINAFNSLALTIYANLNIKDFYFENGRPEPGQNNVKMHLKVYNRWHWQNASNVVLQLSTEDPDIQITDNEIDIPSVNNGDTVNTSDYFEFNVSGNVRTTTFYVTISSQPQNLKQVDTLKVIIGYPGILVVNDAGSNELAYYYESTLQNLHVVYELLNIDQEGVPSFTAHPRDLIIWFTGKDSTEVLSQEEIDSLKAYLEQGGNLFITSQYLAEDPDAQEFVNNYLKAQIVATSVNKKSLKGYDGDPIGDSISLKLYGSGSAGDNISPDKITALPGADTALHYTTPTGAGNYGPGAVYYDSGTYKTVYFAFPFEAIDNNTAGRTTREQMMYRLFQWFGLEYRVEEQTSGHNYHTFKVLLPRIARNILNLKVILPEKNPVEFGIYNVLGQRIYHNQLILQKGINKVNLDLKNWKAGLYFIKVETKTYGNKTLKVIKMGN